MVLITASYTRSWTPIFLLVTLSSYFRCPLTSQDGRVEGYAVIFSCKNSKITTHCWRTIDRRMLNHTKKRYPTSRAKEKPQQDGSRGKITFRIKPHTCQIRSNGSNKPHAHQGPKTPQRLSQSWVWVSPVEVQVSSALRQGQGLWVQQTWIWH